MQAERIDLSLDSGVLGEIGVDPEDRWVARVDIGRGEETWRVGRGFSARTWDLRLMMYAETYAQTRLIIATMKLNAAVRMTSRITPLVPLLAL